MSASWVPTVPVLLYDVLMPLYGSPILSMMLEMFPGGICSVMFMAAQQKFRHCWKHRAGEHIGGQHRKDDGLAEWHEEVSRDTRQEEHRKEHNADRYRCHKCRRGDLLSTIEDGLFDLLSHRDISIDVLDFHRGIIDENSDCQGQATQSHDVDGFAEGAKKDDGAKDGKGYGNSDDDRAPPAS